MRRKRSIPVIAWSLCALCVAGVTAQVVLLVNSLTAVPALSEIADFLTWNVAGPLTFAVLAVLIISRQPGNRVGWLMMIVALAGVFPSIIIDTMPAPPAKLTPGLWLLLWYYGWGWITTMFPIFLIPLHFPTGRPPSPRWNWVNYLAVGMVVFFLSTTSFGKTIETSNWSISNPIGFIPDSFFQGPFLFFWFIGLITLVLSSVVSLFVRYRKSNREVRQQIKWLVYAVVLFAVIYIGFILLNLVQLTDSTGGDPLVNEWGNLIFNLSILVIPAAVAISILRYRLYDIDLIIRRTLQYSLLTGLLSLVFFGGVALLQALLGVFGGQSSPLIIVLTTLLIAALFNPLRLRLQSFIDRRFYRQKYDAEKALAEFAAGARSETDLSQLSNHLTLTIQSTLHPQTISLWMQPTHARRKPDE